MAQTTNEHQPLLLTVKEAAELLRISRTTLFGLMQNDRIKRIRMGRVVRIARAEIDRFLADASEID